MAYQPWYKEKKDIHLYIFPYIKKLENNQTITSEDNLKHLRLYGNKDFLSSRFSGGFQTAPYFAGQQRLTLNIVQSVIDTATSKITKSRPLPQFLTTDGDFSQQRRAKKLTQFVEGQFHMSEVFDIMPKVFRDACIFGTGILKIYREDKKICCERVFPDEIKVDANEGLYGKPRQIHQTKWIHKDVLIEMFPKSKADLDFATAENSVGVDRSMINGEMIMVVESWKLPSNETSGDGVHCITAVNCTLFKEVYEKDHFPFVFLRWNERPLGFWGQGIAEQLSGIQLEINKLLKVIQTCMHLGSVPKIFIEASSKIIKSELNNEIGGIVTYAGQPPTPGQLMSVPPELFQQLDRLYQRAYEIVGISAMSAQSNKPAGLNSGKALRTYSDIESERFSVVAKQYEKAHLDIAKIMICYAKEIGKETRNYSVKVPGSKFLSTISWKDVNMDEDSYIMQVFPVAALSKEPVARFQEIQELIQAGLVERERAIKLLDFPDLEGFYSLESAAVENIEQQIELMIDKGEYQTPEPFQNLAFGIKLMTAAYLKYKNQNCPEESLELLRQWISDANELLQQAAAPPEMAPGPEMSSAQGQPSAPPVSDLMPR